MKKRVISILLTVLMLISMLSVFPFSVTAAAAVSYVYSPALLIGGETEYNIVWKTNVNSVGYVTYTYGGKTYTVYDEVDGVVVSDDYVHSVKVPMEHLNSAGKYVAYSAAVESRSGYSIKLGTPVAKEGKVKFNSSGDNYKIGCFSDIHLYEDTARQGPLERSIYALNNYMNGVDLITLNGDVASIMTTEKYLDLLLMSFERFSADGTPILYTAGNHECRGITAQRLSKYFGFSETEDLFGRVKFGSVEFIVTFSGEDKIDEHQEYGDLNAMEVYKEEEYEWFYSLEGFTGTAKYNISISHSHNLVDIYRTNDFMQRIAEYDPDIHINGHTHAQKIDRPSNYTFPFLHDGAHNDNTTMRTTLVTLSNGTYQITGFNDGGTVTLDDNQTKAKNYSKACALENAETEDEEEVSFNSASAATVETTETVAEVETVETVETKTVPTAAGVVTSSLKGASDTTAVYVKPTVFDAGNYYNVVWQTTPGVDASGEVIVTLSSGVSVRYKDQVIGKLRTDSTHSVRIPKESFGTCKYEAKARVVIHYTFGGYVTSPPTSYGAYVSTGQVSFKGEPTAKQSKFTLLAVTGIKTQAHAEKVKSEMGNKTPDMLITLGNMVNSLDDEKDFGSYLKVTQTITGGKYPVIYLRGENETKGAYAAKIGNYVRNYTSESVMGKFYLNSTYDEVSIIGLDTATTAADSDSAYNGYAAFDKIRQEQVTWLTETIPNSFKGTYNIVFANADNLRDCVGVDFTPGFKSLGTNLTVTGQSGKAAMSLGIDTYSKAICGSPEGDSTFGLLIVCEDEKIEVEALGGNELGTVDCESSTAENDSSISDTPSTGDDSTTTNPGTTTTPGTTTNPGTTTTPGTITKPSTGTQGSTQFVEGTYEGVDGDSYIRQVDENWYKAYTSLGFDKAGSAPKSNGTTTELEFINMAANLSSVNLYFFNGSTDADKAAAWAKEYGIYNGYLGSAPVSDNIITTVSQGVFAVANAE